MFTRAVVLTVFFSFANALVSVQANAQSTAPNAQKTKQEALEWVDRYARFQVLFHPEDVKKLRDRLAAMTPASSAV